MIYILNQVVRCYATRDYDPKVLIASIQNALYGLADVAAIVMIWYGK